MNKQIPNSVELINSHLDEFFDKSAEIIVLDEIKSEIIHSDIYIIKANNDRPFNILLSCGMSALPMNVPDDIDASQYAEVMMLLPKNWNLNYDSFNDERNYWPFRILKELTKLPHENETWLGYGHTYDNDEEFAKGIGFCSVILINSMELSQDFTRIELEDKVIEVFSIIPLYKEEVEYKKKYGRQKLFEKFEEFRIEEVVEIGRINTCK